MKFIVSSFFLLILSFSARAQIDKIYLDLPYDGSAFSNPIALGLEFKHKKKENMRLMAGFIYHTHTYSEIRYRTDSSAEFLRGNLPLYLLDSGEMIDYQSNLNSYNSIGVTVGYKAYTQIANFTLMQTLQAQIGGQFGTYSRSQGEAANQQSVFITTPNSNIRNYVPLHNPKSFERTNINGVFGGIVYEIGPVLRFNDAISVIPKLRLNLHAYDNSALYGHPSESLLSMDLTGNLGASITYKFKQREKG